MKKPKYPKETRILRGRIARKMHNEGVELEEIGKMWDVHELTIKFYMMEERHAREKIPRNWSKNRRVG